VTVCKAADDEPVWVLRATDVRAILIAAVIGHPIVAGFNG
jgi:hypothetical protein